MLVMINWEAGVLALYINFPSKGCSMQINCRFQNSTVPVILERKDYCAAYMVFPIIWAYIDCATGFWNNANMTGDFQIYSNMASKFVS